nr:hypothetical protein [Agrococcus pavilionensis]
MQVDRRPEPDERRRAAVVVGGVGEVGRHRRGREATADDRAPAREAGVARAEARRVRREGEQRREPRPQRTQHRDALVAGVDRDVHVEALDAVAGPGGAEQRIEARVAVVGRERRDASADGRADARRDEPPPLRDPADRAPEPAHGAIGGLGRLEHGRGELELRLQELVADARRRIGRAHLGDDLRRDVDGVEGRGVEQHDLLLDPEGAGRRSCRPRCRHGRDSRTRRSGAVVPDASLIP